MSNRVNLAKLHANMAKGYKVSEAAWQAARIAFENPLRPTSLTEIARSIGVSRAAVYAKASSNGWKLPLKPAKSLSLKIHEQAIQHVQSSAKEVANTAIQQALSAVTVYANEKVKGWVDRSIKSAEKGMGEFDRLVGYASDGASLKELAISLDRFDMIGRRAFGLDDSGSMRRVPGRGGGVMPVIEAEIVPDKPGSQG